MFYNIVQNLCDKKRISISQMALDLKISKSNITNWKNGSRPRADKLEKIAAYFNVSVDYLLGNKQKNKPAAESDELNQLLSDPELKEIYGNLMKLSPDGIRKVLEFARFQHEQETK